MSTYEQNLSQLKVKFPKVYEWMINEDEDKSVEVILTKSGLNNMRLKDLRGKSTCLYCMDDPLREEAKAFKGIFSFSRNTVTVVIGIGLGYGIEIIKDKMQKGHKIIVFERSATILKKGLAQTDICTLLRNDDIILSLPNDESIKSNLTKYVSLRLPEDVRIIWNKGLIASRKEYIDFKDRVVKHIIAQLVMNNSLFENSKRIVENEIYNLPKYLFSPGIKNLFNKFLGIPAIIISAGPSLEKNVQLLKQAEGKALLIATSRVVRVLLGHDIKPDMMVSIDFGEKNRNNLHGILEYTDIPLVYPLALNHIVVKDFQGDMFAIQGVNCSLGWLYRDIEAKGYMNPGKSVAICALRVALACGCDPIIFVGQDLSFSDKMHIEGTGGCRKVDTKERKDDCLWVDGMYGGKIPTTAAMMSYKSALEEIISQSDRTFINATEGGVNIRGTKAIPLKECADRYCNNTVNIEAIINRSKDSEMVDFDGLMRDIGLKINEMREMLSLCDKGLKANKKIGKRIKRGLINDLKTDKLIRDNYNISERLQQFSKYFATLDKFLNKEKFEINRYEHNSPSSLCEKEEDLSIYVRKNKIYLSGVQKALKKLRIWFSALLTILRRIQSRRRQVIGKHNNGKACYHYGKVLSEIGLHKLAIEEYKKALELGEGGYDINFDLGISNIHLGRLSKAQEYFSLAQHMATKERAMQNGYDKIEEIKAKWLEEAESYLAEHNWVNGLLYARKVLSAYPDHLRAKEIAKEAETLRDEKVRSVEEANERGSTQRCTKEKHQTLVEQAKESLNKKEYQQAVDYLEKALELDYDEIEVNSLLACCYSEMGDIDQAKNLFEGLSDKFPKSGLFHLNLGRAFIRNGDFMEAAKQLELAASKEKKYYYVFFEGGMIYMNTRDYDKAIECFEKYLQMSPDSYELLTKIGTCYLAKGAPWKAKKKYMEALKIQTNYEAAQVGLRKIEEMEQSARLKKSFGEPQGEVRERSAGGGP